MAESAFEKKLVKALNRQGLADIPYEDDESGEIISVTHIDALAKTLWKMSLGYPVYKEVEEDGRTVRKFHQYVGPDKAVINTLLDRLVGKPKQPSKQQKDDKAAKPVPAHQRVGQARVEHLNQIAEDADANSKRHKRADKARSKGPFSKRLKDLGMSRNRVQGSEEPDS